MARTASRPRAPCLRLGGRARRLGRLGVGRVGGGPAWSGGASSKGEESRNEKRWTGPEVDGGRWMSNATYPSCMKWMGLNIQQNHAVVHCQPCTMSHHRPQSLRVVATSWTVDLFIVSLEQLLSNLPWAVMCASCCALFFYEDVNFMGRQCVIRRAILLFLGAECETASRKQISQTL